MKSITEVMEDIVKPYIDTQNQALTNYVADNNVKNILPNDKTSQTVDGVTFTVNSDGSVTANGTATSTIYYRVLYISNNYPLTAGKQYKLSGCPAGGGNNTYKLQAEMNGQTIANSEDTGNGATFTAPEFNTRFAIYIRIPNGYTISNQLFKPMITDADIPDSDYAHYQPYAKTNVELTQDVAYEYLYFTDTNSASDGDTDLKRFVASFTRCLTAFNAKNPVANRAYNLMLVVSGTTIGTFVATVNVTATAMRGLFVYQNNCISVEFLRSNNTMYKVWSTMLTEISLS